MANSLTALERRIADQLACATDRRDEQPNIALAERLASDGEDNEFAALASLTANGSKPQRHDAIKAFYEFAERQPSHAKAHTDQLLSLLNSNDNRMIWGAMSALAAIASENPEPLAQNLNPILEAADRGSVIAKDKAAALLATLNRDERFTDLVTPVIFTRLRFAAVNQTPMYAELAAPTVRTKDWGEFAQIVSERRDSIPHPPKKKRLQKVLDVGPTRL